MGAIGPIGLRSALGIPICVLSEFQICLLTRIYINKRLANTSNSISIDTFLVKFWLFITNKKENQIILIV